MRPKNNDTPYLNDFDRLFIFSIVRGRKCGQFFLKGARDIVEKNKRSSVTEFLKWSNRIFPETAMDVLNNQR